MLFICKIRWRIRKSQNYFRWSTSGDPVERCHYENSKIIAKIMILDFHKNCSGASPMALNRVLKLENERTHLKKIFIIMDEGPFDTFFDRKITFFHSMSLHVSKLEKKIWLLWAYFELEIHQTWFQLDCMLWRHSESIEWSKLHGESENRKTISDGADLSIRWSRTSHINLHFFLKIMILYGFDCTIRNCQNTSKLHSDARKRKRTTK